MRARNPYSDSEQCLRLKYVDQTYPALASGKQVLQKSLRHFKDRDRSKKKGAMQLIGYQKWLKRRANYLLNQGRQ